MATLYTQPMTTLDLAPPSFVQLPALRMAYREWGPPQAAAAVVLIHGITSSSLSWIRVGPRLGERFHVVAVDLKGHGDSEQPKSGYRLPDQAREVAELSAALGIERAIVVGHSWGGALAVHLATSTNLVSRLVLEDPAIGEREPHPQRDERRAGYAANVGLSREQAEALARPNLAIGWTDADVAGKVDAAMKGSPTAVRAVFEENEPWDLHDLLPTITCPTLLVLAGKDSIVDHEAASLAEANPNVRAGAISVS